MNSELPLMELLKIYETKGLITLRKHNHFDLYIANYTPKCVYDKLWDDITLMCRGLIVNNDGEIIARPFSKFFNLQENDNISKVTNENFLTTKKMDGSLGISYFVNDKMYISTRGSFHSEQAEKANILLQNYPNFLKYADKKYTYLFEIILRDNKIVVDYVKDELVLIGVIETETNNDVSSVMNMRPDTHLYDLPIVEFLPINNVQALQEVMKNQPENEEGYVLLFGDDTRVKVKFDEYVRLHRLITTMSSTSIWESLKNEDDITKLLDNVPDEFYDWIKNTKDELVLDYNNIETYCEKYLECVNRTLTRKEQAEFILKSKYPGIIFNMLDGKSYDNLIWTIIKPKYERPYRKNIDNE